MLHEVLIILSTKQLDDLEKTIRRIEKSGGRVIASYPSAVLQALVALERLGELSRLPEVKSIFDDHIPDSQLDRASDEVRTAMAAWNEHLNQLREKRPPRQGEGLSWDSAGMLPPDPPPSVREELIRREQDQDSQSAGDDKT